jgi:hypothetical protein
VSDAAVPASTPPGAFAPRTILALVLVGVVSFAGLALLAAYAPDLRGATDAGAHALSSSAVGFKGAMVMLQAEGVPVVASRTELHGGRTRQGLTVLTPGLGSSLQDMQPFIGQPHVLIVLPKWQTQAQPLHIGWADKVGLAPDIGLSRMLAGWAPRTGVRHRQGITRPRLYGAGGPFAPGTYLPLAPIDRLQTLVGDGWTPALVDEQGGIVLAASKKHPQVLVLADPDLLNTQGLAKLDNARAGMAILNALRGDQGVIFDVTLDGFSRGQGVGRLMLEPPWLAATLCGVAAAILMGLHALARFGPTRRPDRAIALGKRALVDNSAGLVRMAGREAELAPAYADLTKALVRRSAGGAPGAAPGADGEAWLADLARRRGAEAPASLGVEAERAASRDDLLAIGRKLYSWRLEITRERR